MAHVWLQDHCHQWVARTLAGAESGLCSILAAEENPAAGPVPPDLYFMQSAGEGPAEWVILAGPGCDISVNGIPLLLGIRVLADRDDICWGQGGCAYYSTEEPAAVTNLPESDRKLFCPRCKQEIAPGTPAVRCPRCGIWHHQSGELPCYTYAERCATCTRTTTLDSGYDWTPEDL